MSYERPCYEDIHYHPWLFYVIFGVQNEELSVSRQKHHVDEFPDGLDFSFLTKAKNEAYMASLMGGALGEVLDRGNHALYEAVRQTDRWAVIRGEIQRDGDLHYLRNAVGFVQALAEKGAAGILDLQTITLYTPEEWQEKIFSPEFDPRAHVTILVSEMEDGSAWLHTRGMRKFGRPDISMETVENTELQTAIQVINQMIYYGAQGAFFFRPVKLHIPGGAAYRVTPEFIEDFENPDFNNAYYRILWSGCEAVE